MSNNANKALFILQSTRDGDDLAPSDLTLTENAVNDNLNEAGQEVFDSLYEKIKAGEYVAPWLHGVPHFTKDHEGYVYYKGSRVEHFSYRCTKQEQLAVQKLAKRCEHLESLGVPINSSSAVWHESWFEDQTKDSQYLPLLAAMPNVYASMGEVVFIENKRGGDRTFLVNSDGVRFFQDLSSFLATRNASLDDHDESLYHAMKSIGFHIPRVGQPDHAGICCATGEQLSRFFESRNVPATLMDTPFAA